TPFRYAAVEAAGARRRGVIVAASEAEAADLLARAGLTPVRIEPGRRPSRPRAKLEHRAAAMRRLAALAEAKAPLDRALRLSGGSESAKGLYDDLALAVESGRALSDAMSDWPGDFSAAEVALIASGEAAGAAPRATDAAATLIERRLAGRRAVAAALAYPAFVLVAAIAALAIFIGFAQPRFEEVLLATGAEMSPETEWFFAVSGVLRSWGGAILAGVGLLALAALIASGAAAGKRVVAGIAMRAPLVGPVLANRAFEGFAGALGAMLSGGAPLPDAVRLAAKVMEAPYLSNAGEAAARAIRQGEGFSHALRGTGAFPESLSAFAEIGEETGALAPLMDRAAAHFGQEAETRARRLSAVAAPAATAILGLLIAVGAYLMMTAVLDVYDAAL
ncbi:MAG: type II secretion system F family protein, partial [Pseudomonadota bacterium]